MAYFNFSKLFQKSSAKLTPDKSLKFFNPVGDVTLISPIK